MTFPISIPRLGWSMEEGTFVGWLKQDGQPVKAGEPLFALESEKSTQDVEAADTGVLRLRSDSPKPGDVVKVGQTIGLLMADAGDAAPAIAIAAAATAKAASAPTLATPAGGREVELANGPGAAAAADAALRPAGARRRVAISPRARRRATESGVDVTQLQGTGRTGRIIETDVLQFAGRQGESFSTTAKPASAPAMALTSTRRRLIAERTARSFASVPHFYLRREVDATALLRLREALLSEIESVVGARLTLTDLLLRAQAMALRDFPAANSVWVDDRLVGLPSCDVGLVVGLADGLVIPVVRGAPDVGLAALVKQRAALVVSAKAGRLTQDEMRGGASSLSNLGKSAADEFAAVIAPGQSSMLAVGRAAPRPFVVEGSLAVRTTLKLCLSVDHRVLDGAPAADFLGRIVDRLESPAELG